MNNKLPKEQETFNEETISALNEVDEMRKHPEQYPSYTSVDTMFDTLLKEDTSKLIESPGIMPRAFVIYSRFNLSAYLISRISDG